MKTSAIKNNRRAKRGLKLIVHYLEFANGFVPSSPQAEEGAIRAIADILHALAKASNKTHALQAAWIAQNYFDAETR